MPDALDIVDTRPLFRPVSAGLVALLRSLDGDTWQRPTIAGPWRVRDVVAHLLDTTLRRLSFHRDGMAPPPPDRPIASDRDFTAFINGLNAQWVGASRRLSPRVLTDLYARASAEAADFYETLPLEAPALFPLSWAGDDAIATAGWFDVGREFTELWHHHAQIRLAVGAAADPDPRPLAAVLEVTVLGLPHALRAVDAAPGDAIVVDIEGPSGGSWTLRRDAGRWTIRRGRVGSPVARLTLRDDAAWRLLFNALPKSEAAAAVQVEGRADVGRAFLAARSVIV